MHITNAVAYNAFRTWVDTKGLNHQTVKDSPRAWFSYALQAPGLVEREFDGDDLRIVSVASASGGTFTFDAVLDGAPIGAGASPERLATIFEVEGAASLSADTFAADSVDVSFSAGADGQLSVTVTPKVASDRFFLRLKAFPNSAVRGFAQ